jgi:hypothetical protein
MNDKIKELIKLSEENPEMEIKIMVNQDVVAGDDFAYWMAEIENISKDIYWVKDEHVIIGENEISDELDLEADDVETAEDYIDKRFKELKESKDIKEAIIVYIGV